MFKFIKVSIAVLLVMGLSITYVQAGDYTRHNALEIQRTRGDDYEGRDSLKIDNLAGTARFKVLPDGTMVIFDASGVTTFHINANGGAINSVAVLSGATGDIAWTTYTPDAAKSGHSGWTLSETQLQRYDTFYVETSQPVDVANETSGSSEFSHQCQVAKGGSGETIYIPSPSADCHNKVFRFVNRQGTTPFVVYAPDGRIDGGSGTTHGYNFGTNDTSCEDAGDTVVIQCIYTPSAVSGWYVLDVNKRD